MSTDTPRSAPSRRNRLIAIGAAVVALIVIVALVALALGNNDGTPAPAATSSSARPTSTPKPTLTPSPSATPSPEPSASATPAPGVVDPTSPGETEVTVPIESQPEARPGVSLALAELVSVRGTADEPGEIAGPALRFIVEVTNSTGDEVSLRDVAVTLDYGDDREPASQLNDPSAVPLPDTVAAGQKATGSYIFTVPSDARDLVRISVFLSVDNPIVVFTGIAPQ